LRKFWWISLALDPRYGYGTRARDFLLVTSVAPSRTRR
jgi:hypothetical protein